MSRRLRWRVLVTALVTIVMGVSIAYPPLADRLGWRGPRFLLQKPLTLGLDLRGGVQFVLRVNADERLREGGDVTRAQIVEQARETIRRRVDQLGVVEPSIAVQGARRDQLVVQLPGFTDVDRARKVLGTTAHLEWRIVDAGPAASVAALRGPGAPDAGEILPAMATGPDGSPLYYRVDRQTGLAGRDIRRAQVVADRNGLPAVSFSLTADGAARFGELTATHVGRQLAIVLDGRVQSAPVIEHAIPGGDGVIEGRFSRDEAADLALVLRAGSLPVSLTFLGGEYVGPTLGMQSIWAGVTASTIGLLLVAAFMLAYYGRAGVNAVVTLGVNVLILAGALAWAGAALTLPGIAGVILTIGMGVDANVLIFERVKEELASGRPLRGAVTAGFDRVFLTILDTHVTSLVAAAVLFQFGTGAVRGFATTLAIGMLANVFTAVFVSRTLFDWALSRRRRGSPDPRFGRTFPATAIDFLGVRRLTIAVSTVLIAAGLLAAVGCGGLPLGLDFTGGTAAVTRFARAVSPDEVRRALPAGATVQRYGPEAHHELLIRLPAAAGTATSDEAGLDAGLASLRSALERAGAPGFEIAGGQVIGPSIGADLQRKGIYATAASLAAMTAYIALRFRPGFAAGALVATVHDMLITVSVLSLCRYDMTLDVVAAVLTVAGYSVNDTIVIFDRVREASRAARRAPIGTIINGAINQTLGRTVITAGTILVAVLALWIAGGDALRGFAFAMVVGVVTGTYSTVFVAAPVATWLVRRRSAAA
jgi:SecD/SecF fusion protein